MPGIWATFTRHICHYEAVRISLEPGAPINPLTGDPASSDIWFGRQPIEFIFGAEAGVIDYAESLLRGVGFSPHSAPAVFQKPPERGGFMNSERNQSSGISASIISSSASRSLK